MVEMKTPLIALLALVSAAGATTLVVEMNYSNGTLSCLSAAPQNGFADDYRLFPNGGRFSYRLYAANGGVLDSFYFDAPMVWWDGVDENGTMIGGTMEGEGAFSVSAKHFDDASRLIVKDGTKVACDISFTSATATPTAKPTATPSATTSATPAPTAQPAANADIGTASFLALLALLCLAGLFLIGRKRR